MKSRARIATVLIAGTAIAGAVLAAIAVAALDKAWDRSAPTLPGNRRAARRDVRRLLGMLRLPAGAIHVSTEPGGDGGWLKPLPALTATTANADAHGWWRVPGSPGSVIAYIRTHPLAGATLSSTGSGENGRTGRTELTVSYGWHAIAGVIRLRALAIYATALSDAVTGVLAQAESDWIVPRPASERIPAATHEIDISSAKLHGPTAVSLIVTSPAKVRRIVSLFNAMPIAQPAAYACPALMLAGARVIRISFRTGRGGSLLARATYIDYPPLPAASGPCTPIELSIDGRRRDPLIGGNFLKTIHRIIGIRVT
jgi:hypothetical protein